MFTLIVCQTMFQPLGFSHWLHGSIRQVFVYVFLSAKTTSCKFELDPGVGAKAADQVLAVPRSFRATHILGACTVTGAFVPALSPRKCVLMLGCNPPTSHADHHYIYLAQRISLSYGSTRTTFLPISHTCVPVPLH